VLILAQNDGMRQFLMSISLGLGFSGFGWVPRLIAKYSSNFI
jgi:hypothetical protein